MRIVVDQLPTGCIKCLFVGHEGRLLFCRLTEKKVIQSGAMGHLADKQKNEDCPLVEFKELMKEA